MCAFMGNDEETAWLMSGVDMHFGSNDSLGISAVLVLFKWL